MEHETAFEQDMEQCKRVLYKDMGKAVSKAYKKTSHAVSGTYCDAIRYGREHYGTSTLVALGMGIGMGLYLGGSYKKSRLAHFARPMLESIYGISRGFLR